MSYIFKEIWCNKSNFREANRTADDIDYIVVHYTANDGDTDENNGNYFKNNYVGASAHYFVDSDSVTRSIADKNIAWHCGDDVYYHPYCRNSNSIGIEICDDNYNGSIYPSAKTIENAILLTQRLMKKYNIPKENVIRHWDVTLADIERQIKAELRNKVDELKRFQKTTTGPEDAKWYYLAPMLMDGSTYVTSWFTALEESMNDTDGDVEDAISSDRGNKAFLAHMERLKYFVGLGEDLELGKMPDDLISTLTDMVLGSPAVCIYRANGGNVLLLPCIVPCQQ